MFGCYRFDSAELFKVSVCWFFWRLDFWGCCFLLGIWGDSVVQECMLVLVLKVVDWYNSANLILGSCQNASLKRNIISQLIHNFTNGIQWEIDKGFIELRVLFVSVQRSETATKWSKGGLVIISQIQGTHSRLSENFELVQCILKAVYLVIVSVLQGWFFFWFVDKSCISSVVWEVVCLCSFEVVHVHGYFYFFQEVNLLAVHGADLFRAIGWVFFCFCFAARACSCSVVWEYIRDGSSNMQGWSRIWFSESSTKQYFSVSFCRPGQNITTGDQLEIDKGIKELGNKITVFRCCYAWLAGVSVSGLLHLFASWGDITVQECMHVHIVFPQRYFPRQINYFITTGDQ